MQRKEQIKKRDKLKAFKQLQKEERSGLFSREQVNLIYLFFTMINPTKGKSFCYQQWMIQIGLLRCRWIYQGKFQVQPTCSTF